MGGGERGGGWEREFVDTWSVTCPGGWLGVRQIEVMGSKHWSSDCTGQRGQRHVQLVQTPEGGVHRRWAVVVLVGGVVISDCRYHPQWLFFFLFPFIVCANVYDRPDLVWVCACVCSGRLVESFSTKMLIDLGVPYVRGCVL